MISKYENFEDTYIRQLISFVITGNQITAMAIRKTEKMSCMAKTIPSGCASIYGGRKYYV